MTSAQKPLLLEGPDAQVEAIFLGARIDVRELERAGAVALTPLTLRVGEGGYAILFRYGVVATLSLTPPEAAAFLQSVSQYVEAPFEEPETEVVSVTLTSEGSERIDANGTLRLRELSLERLTVVANILAKSAVLSHYEERVAVAFDEIERLARQLRQGSGLNASGRDLLQQIGNVLIAQIQTVGRVEVTEKPEITWDHPDLDRLYERLSLEYELRDRDLALTRKLDFISQIAQTYLDLLQSRQSLRVEWYIVLLILFEIGLFIYELFFA